MITRICLGLSLLVAMPAWAQVEPSATGSPASDEAMQTPPPVSGASYPTETGSEARSNYLRAGFSAYLGYDNNVLENGSSTPAADFNYSIRPAIAIDQSTPRTHRAFGYSPSFTIYQNDSSRNESDQDATASFQYRLSPHTEISLTDSFEKSTNVFNQPLAGVSGSPQVPTEAVIAPFAEHLGNTSSAEFSYQFSLNGMFGASGMSAIVNYPNPAQASGLTNSNSYGASAFYNLRLSNTQYMGFIYQHATMAASAASGNSNTGTDTIYCYYTLYLKHALSLSASGGPQHFDVNQVPFPESAAWTPAITASAGWQLSRINFAVSYSRTVSGAGGLVGAFNSSSVNGFARWQLARTWTMGGGASYATQNNVVPALASLNPGGHTVSGTFSVQHPISEHFAAEAGYARLHQIYSGISSISQFPDSDREYVAISYQLSRPLGR